MNNAPLNELLSTVVDNRGRTCPVADRGFPLIATNCVKSDQLYPVYEKIRFVDDETYKNWFRGHPKPGDFIFVLKGSPGEVCLTPEPVPFCIAQDMVALRANPEKVNPAFLFAFLRSKAAKDAILNMHVGTMIPHFKKGDFDKLIVPLPNEISQQFIGDWYLTLSKKIELNRRTNETLEALAQAIFKDWFVDFGPVRRKQEGATDPVTLLGGLITDPARAAEVAALFPGSFGDDGLPEGWEGISLLELADWVNGAAYKNMHFVPPDDGMPVIKIAELKAGVTSQTKFTNTDLGDRYRISNDELLFSWSGNPDTSIDAFIWTGGDAWLNQHIFAVRTNGKRSKPFLYVMLKFLMPEFSELARNKQTTGLGHVTKADMKKIQVPVSPEELTQAFSALATLIFDRIVLSLHENRTLAETRDYLLPKLMSGEVRVGDIEELAG